MPRGVGHRTSKPASGSGGAGARSGFTLLEGLLAAAILAIATVAVISPIMAARQQTEAVAHGHEALGLARQLMEEIASRPYADPDDGNTIRGPEPTETERSLFDNVDDYHGYADSTAAMKMLSGETLKQATMAGPSPAPGKECKRRVEVQYRAGPQGPEVVVGDFALVTVTVTPSKGSAVRLSKLVTRVEMKR